MKTIGILGGMSATSTQLYYKTLCELTKKQLGGLNSPQLLIRSLNFEPIEKLMLKNEWQKIGHDLNQEAIKLMRGGAEFLLLATNTMHKLVEHIMKDVNIPLLHIADATACALNKHRYKKPAFIATQFTMDETFYIDILKKNNLTPILPNNNEKTEINRIIFEELCRNDLRPHSQKFYIDVVNNLKNLGADSVILGCTEICLLLNEKNTHLPIFDTTYIHCEAALKKALE